MIHAEAVETILNKPILAEGLEKYSYIMSRIRETDVSSDSDFQNVFRNFYQMRRFYSDYFACHYFMLMEQLKDTGENMTFAMAMERIKHIQGTYEMSFASKLLHTVDPLHPIWDSVVTNRHFEMKAPYASCKNREIACCNRYAEYEDKFYDYMATEEGCMIIHMFDERFPNNGISDVKKIDFILWQDRKKKI
jgi:hypothetical protein